MDLQRLRSVEQSRGTSLDDDSVRVDAQPVAFVAQALITKEVERASARRFGGDADCQPEFRSELLGEPLRDRLRARVGIDHSGSAHLKVALQVPDHGRARDYLNSLRRCRRQADQQKNPARHASQSNNAGSIPMGNARRNRRR